MYKTTSNEEKEEIVTSSVNSSFSSSSSTPSTESSSYDSENDGTTETDKHFSHSNDFFSNEHSSFKNDKNIQKKWKYISLAFLMVIIFLILFNLIIIIIGIGLVQKKGGNIIMNNEDKVKNSKYQIIQYDNTKNIVNEIVEYNEGVEFEGDFLPFKDEKGNGIIIKIDEVNDDEKIYKMCSDECKCFVECEKEDDCGNGMKCVENACVDENNVKKRRDTNSESERKFAQVAMIVPIFACTFGLFSSVFLAKEYGKQYFSDVCEEACPESTEEVEVETEIVEEIDKRQKSFHCYGSCSTNNDQLRVAYDALLKHLKIPGYKMIRFNDFASLSDYAKEQLNWFDANTVKALELCESHSFDGDVIAINGQLAVEEFRRVMLVRCNTAVYDFHDVGEWASDLMDAFQNVNICETVPHNIVCEDIQDKGKFFSG